MRGAGSIILACLSHQNFVVYGKLNGPAECGQPTKWGHVILTPSSDGGVNFEITIPVKDAVEAGHLVGLVPAAVRAFIALGWAVWVNPVITSHRFIRSDGTSRVGSQVQISWNVRADLSKGPDSRARTASKIQEAILNPSDARLVELISLFALGLEGAQETVLITGLWAFANVIEEESSKPNIDHATQLAADLRQKGYSIEPDPVRKPSRIRAAALHPTPKDPSPTDDEVRWLMDIARSYLVDRASRI